MEIGDRKHGLRLTRHTLSSFAVLFAVPGLLWLSHGWRLDDLALVVFAVVVAGLLGAGAFHHQKAPPDLTIRRYLVKMAICAILHDKSLGMRGSHDRPDQ